MVLDSRWFLLGVTLSPSREGPERTVSGTPGRKGTPSQGLSHPYNRFISFVFTFSGIVRHQIIFKNKIWKDTYTIVRRCYNISKRKSKIKIQNTWDSNTGENWKIKERGVSGLKVWAPMEGTQRCYSLLTPNTTPNQHVLPRKIPYVYGSNGIGEHQALA